MSLRWGRSHPRRLVVLALSTLLTIGLAVAPKPMSEKAGDGLPAPAPEETISLEIILYDPNGTGAFAGRLVTTDIVEIQRIYDCVVPCKVSDMAAQLSTFPKIGLLGFRGATKTSWIEFADAGANPLCFMAQGVGYFHSVDNARADHRRCYGVDWGRGADECLMLHDKLKKLCQAGPSQAPTIRWRGDK